MKAVVIKPDGTATLKDLPGYVEMKAELNGGYLEIVRFARDLFFYIDEDGKAKDLPYNQKVTELCFQYGIGLSFSDYIVGAAIFVGPPDSEGNDTDVSLGWQKVLLRS